MKITVDNYEAYFLDYLEGQLDSEELSELSLFLSLHPELKAQIENSEIIPIHANSQTYKYKASLKKFDFTSISNYNFNDYCIAFYEHLLTPQKVKALKVFCDQNPNRKTDFEAYRKVYVKPQLSLKYKGKKNLYKKLTVQRPVPTRLLYIVSLAASVTLIMIFYWINTNKFENRKSPIAVLNTKNRMLPETNPTNSEITHQTQKVNTGKKIVNISRSSTHESKNHTTIGPIQSNREELSLALLPSLEAKLIETQNYSNAKLMESQKVPESEVQHDPQTLTATVGNTLEKIRSGVLNLDYLNVKDNKGNISLIKLAKAGITGINKFTESNMSLKEQTDSTGNITAYSFNSEIIKFQKSIRN